jgi:rod shape-determining protein MreC
MAPPSPRRPGFSRRAQFSIFASYVIALTGLAVALLLVLTARFDPEGHSALQSLASDIAAPVSAVGRTITLDLGSVDEDIRAYVSAGSKNAALTRDLAASRRQLVQAEAMRVENMRLKALLGIKDKVHLPITAARLISSTGASSRRFATLAAGAEDGVAKGQPVLGPEGLIGRIVAVGRHSARVLLIVDGANVTPVKRASDGTPALAIGTGDGRLTLRPLSGGNAPFRAGDVFITSGSGGIYRPNIPVAQALKAGREGALARPMADPNRLDYALVEPIFQSAPPEAPSVFTSKGKR